MALFRYGVIAGIVRRPPGRKGDGRRLRRLAAAEYEIPGSRRTRIAVSTLRTWVRRYRAGGFDALRPKPRRDLLIELKQRHAHLPVRKVITRARASGQVPADMRMARSTVYRVPRRAGLTARSRPDDPAKDRRRRKAFLLCLAVHKMN